MDISINLFKNILKRDFFQDVSKLGIGVITSQLIGLMAYPILSRIYTPDEFGIYSLFSSSVIVGSILISGTYEFAIPLSKNNNQAKKLIQFCGVVIFLLSTLCLISFLIFSEPLSNSFNVQRSILFLIPIGILFHALLTVKTQYYTYNKAFKEFSVSKVSQTSSLAIIQIVTGLFNFGTYGLIAGHIAGRIGFLSVKIRGFLKSFVPIKLTFKETAKKYREHPLFVLPSSLINSLSKELPVFLILPYFGDQILGQYALAFKVLITPVLLISTSVDSVFYQKISQLVSEKKSVKKQLLKIWATLFSIGIIPFSIIYIWAEPIFKYVFGDPWAFAGHTASILSLMLFLRFIYVPTAKAMLALQKQKWMPIFSIISLFITFTSLYIGYLNNSFSLSLVLLSISQALLYFSQIIFVYFSAHQFDKSLLH